MSRSVVCFAFVAWIAAVPVGRSEDFGIQIASPVAAQSYQMKRSAFVFRTTGCPESVKPEATATAEGIVGGKRTSMPLKVGTAQKPGVFGIFPEWPDEGAWVVNLTARCQSATAGALVATRKKAFIRESSTLLNRAATEADIAKALANVPTQ